MRVIETLYICGINALTFCNKSVSLICGSSIKIMLSDHKPTQSSFQLKKP